MLQAIIHNSSAILSSQNTATLVICGNAAVLLLAVCFRFLSNKKREISYAITAAAFALGVIHFDLYCLLGSQLSWELFQQSPLLTFLLVPLTLLACLCWLYIYPLGLLREKKLVHGTLWVSILLSFSVLLVTAAIITTAHGLIMTATPQKIPFEGILLWLALGSSLLAAGIFALGLQWTAQNTHLFQKGGSYRKQAKRYAMVKQVFSTLQTEPNNEVRSQKALEAIAKMTKASAVYLYHYLEEKGFGSCISAFPKAEEPVIPEELQRLLSQKDIPNACYFQQGFALPIRRAGLSTACLIVMTDVQASSFSSEFPLFVTLCRQLALPEPPRKKKRLTRRLGIFKNVAENLEFAVLATRKTGELMFANHHAENLLGWTKNELRGKSLRELVKQDGEASLENLPLSNRETLLLRKDGRTLPVFCVSAPITLNPSKEGLLYVFHDLSRQKQQEQALKQYASRLRESNRDLERFAYMASHDLQAPLIKMQHFSGMLSRNASLDEESHDMARRIQHSAQRMQKLIQSVLALAQVSASTDHFESVDLRQLTLQVLKDMEEKISQSKAKVHLGQMMVIDGLPELLRILLNNLLDNALKFHRPKQAPEVFIACQASSTNPALCRLRIKDNGIGFPVEESDRIFRMFERLHNHPEYRGNGIGLSICKRIAERHSGSITAYSQVNQGATFTVTLPIKQHS
ncbi:MAG TPA: ATP-binding protein [Oculatellaceae cyanobacterium]